MLWTSNRQKRMTLGAINRLANQEEAEALIDLLLTTRDSDDTSLRSNQMATLMSMPDFGKVRRPTMCFRHRKRGGRHGWITELTGRTQPQGCNR